MTVKNLALTCLSTIIQIYPKALLLYLDKSCAKNGANQQDKQFISDILRFKNHLDPQLRGAVTTLTSNFIKSISDISDGNFQDWINANNSTNNSDEFTIEYLLNYIYRVSTVGVPLMVIIN